MIPVPVRQRWTQTSEDCGLIFPMRCPECAKLTPWRVVSYINRTGCGCLFLPVPLPFTKKDYWLECQSGSHGFRLRSKGLEWAHKLDDLTQAYSRQEITEADYTHEWEHATAKLQGYLSAECCKFPTYTKSSDDEVN